MDAHCPCSLVHRIARPRSWSQKLWSRVRVSFVDGGWLSTQIGTAKFTKYHPHENFRSQDKMFLESISLCKCNFSSFHHYFFCKCKWEFCRNSFKSRLLCNCFFSSIPGFWCPLQGCAIAERIRWGFLPWKSKSLSRCCLGCVARSS